MAPLQPIPNIYDVPHDVNLARNLPPERQLAQVQENFRSLSRNMMSSTLNTFVLVPIKGGLIVGNGTNFVVLPPGPGGLVLVTDPVQPDGLAWKDPITALNVYTDEERRLLEEMVINLYSKLDLIQSMGTRIDVNGEVPSGAINGSNVTFTLAHTPVTGTLKLWLGMLRMRAPDDYSLSGSTITLVAAPLTGETPPLADYRY